MKTGTPLLLEMLTYKRPAGSRAESDFIARYIVPTGARPDDMGNYVLRVGEGSRVAWLSHTETVHRTSGRPKLRIKDNVVTVDHPPNAGQFARECLGADDTTGVWLMLEMIRANVPGLYIFHYGEECGCIGSNYVAQYTPEILFGTWYAISLDRKGTDSVITHQLGRRTASEVFAWSFIDAINLAGAIPDPTGVYTDSEVYASIVPECTNISVGYGAQHTAREYQDLAFADMLRAKLVTFDEAKLICDRAPEADPEDVWPEDDEDDIFGWEWWETADDPNSNPKGDKWTRKWWER